MMKADDTDKPGGDTTGDDEVWAFAEDLSGRPDSELLAMTRDGNGDAFTELWHRHAPAALSTAKALGCRSPEDVVGDAQERIWEALHDGRGPTDDFRKYLFAAIRNTARLAKTYRSELYDEADAPLVVAKEDTEGEMLQAMDARRIDHIFTLMPEREGRMLYATEMRGIPVNDVAAKEGVSAGHASVILGRARRSFRKLWIQDHVNTRTTTSPECLWVLERAGAYLADTLSASLQKRVKDHLKTCDACAVAMDEIKESSFSWGRAAGGGGGGLLSSGGFASTAWAAPTGPLAVVGGAALTTAVVVAGFFGATPTGVEPSLPPPVTPVVSPAPVVTPTAEPDSPTVPPDEPTVSHSPAPAPVGQSPSVSSSVPSPVTPSSVLNWAPINVTADTGPAGLCYPMLSGSAEPGAELRVQGFDWQVAATADASGHWSTVRLGQLQAGTVTYRVVYVDGSGQVASSVQAATPPGVGASVKPTSLSVGASGRPGQTVELILDGVPLATVTLGEDGNYRGEYPLPALGTHQLQARYAPTGCTGPTTTVTVHI